MSRLFQAKLFSRYEIIGFVLIVIAALWLLYPKNKIEDILKNKEGDNLLVVQYIENLSKKGKLDNELLSILIDRYISLGDTNKALEKLKSIGSRVYEDSELSMLKYKVLKSEYFNSSKKESKEQIKSKLYTLLKNMVEKSKNKDELSKYYKEALEFSFYDIALESAKRALFLKEDSIDWFKKGYEVSVAANSIEDAKFFLDKLILKDLTNRDLYLQKKAELEVSALNYEEASKIYYTLYRSDKKRGYEYLLKSAKYEAIAKNYLDSYKKYLLGVKEAKSYKDKKVAFLSAIEVLRWAKREELATRLIEEYKDIFINDEEVVKVMLETSLAANNLRLAHDISKSFAKRLR